MSKYLNILCSYCNKSISNGYIRSGYKSGFGLPYVRCRHCLQLNATGDKLYEDLSPYRKFTFWLYGLLKGLGWGFVLGFLLFGTFGMIFLDNVDNYQTEWKISAIVFAVTNTLRVLYNNVKAIQIIKKAHLEGKYNIYTVNG